MQEEQLKRQLGLNIAFFRKNAGMTQAGLAEKLNYSDKAVSKWERGESLPDVTTLVQLAEIYQITVDRLLQPPAKEEEEPREQVPPVKKRRADRRVIQKLTTVLVWFVALLVFVVLSTLDIPYSWVAFFYAVPVNAIVLLSLRSAWHDFSWNQTLISAIVWGSLASIYVSLAVFFDVRAWKIFMLGIPGQIAIFLWFRMFRVKEEEQNG